MKNFLNAALICVLLINTLSFASDLSGDQKYMKGTVVISFYPETSVNIPLPGSLRSGIGILDDYMDEINASWIERMFPHCLPPKPNGADLTTIYTIKFPESLPVDEIIEDLSKFEFIEYAERWLFHETCFDHNDTFRNRQYYLNLIDVNDAHDLGTGDPDVAVAIVDTGTDLDHEDLEDNLWINPGEDLNGDGQIQNNERNNRDDDDNGYTDDFYGWDFYSGNNNPNDVSGHGTHCSGIACAVTNNRRGIASPGFECSIMAVRSGTGLVVTHGYQGIDYAVRNGAKVISCSWGGVGRNGTSDRIIDYAWQNDVLVVASSGNDNQDGNFYPAGYATVMAVSATDRNDNKAGFSNFGEWVDISAPGVEIYSTYPANPWYVNMQGTSMSGPLVAGAAILFRATFPHLNVEETFNYLIEGADDIEDHLSQQHRGKMGSGRLNINNTMILAARPMLAISELEVVYDDDENGVVDPGESGNIAITLSNDENAVDADEIVVTLSTEDPSITITEDVVEFPPIEAGDSFTNNENPFEIEVAEDVIPHTSVLTFTIVAEPAETEIVFDVEVIIGHPSILLVDDDGGDDYENLYMEALTEIGMGWVKWDVVKDYSPDMVTLLNYDMVIWETGRTFQPLDDLDLFMLENALEDGADILMIGKRIGDDENNRSFLRTKFGANHESDSVRVMTVNGIGGNRPVSENTEMLLFGGGGGDGRSTPSTMSPVFGADSLVVYKMGDDIAGLAGVYRTTREGRDDESKTVYLGFSLEAVNDRFTPKSRVILEIFNWMTGVVVDAPGLVEKFPVEYKLNPAFPNPFNSTVNLNFSLPNRNYFDLSLLDVNGRHITSVQSGFGKTGANQITWDAASISSGIYLVRLSSPGYANIDQRIVLLK